MQITRQTEYAVRLLVELAKNPFGQLASSKILSENQNIPGDFLKKTVQILVRAGLVTTHRGNQGGVKLARPADSITIADVIRAVEGPLTLNVCLGEGYYCPNSATCRVRAILARVQQNLVADLSRETIKDIATGL